MTTKSVVFFTRTMPFIHLAPLMCALGINQRTKKRPLGREFTVLVTTISDEARLRHHLQCPSARQAQHLAFYEGLHEKALYYHNAAGVPFTATYFNAKGDPIADLYEDIAAEEKARATYQWLIDMSDDPEINDSLAFLREREVIHSQRFREAVEILKEENMRQKVF